MPLTGQESIVENTEGHSNKECPSVLPRRRMMGFGKPTRIIVWAILCVNVIGYKANPKEEPR